MHNQNYRPLPAVFVRDGIRCRILQRTESVALIAAGPRHWEVAKIKRHQATQIRGLDIPAREALPSNEEWGGSVGQSFMDYAQALQTYRTWTTVERYKRSEAAA